MALIGRGRIVHEFTLQALGPTQSSKVASPLHLTTTVLAHTSRDSIDFFLGSNSDASRGTFSIVRSPKTSPRARAGFSIENQCLSLKCNFLLMCFIHFRKILTTIVYLNLPRIRRGFLKNPFDLNQSSNSVQRDLSQLFCYSVRMLHLQSATCPGSNNTIQTRLDVLQGVSVLILINPGLTQTTFT